MKSLVNWFVFILVLLITVGLLVGAIYFTIINRLILSVLCLVGGLGGFGFLVGCMIYKVSHSFLDFIDEIKKVRR